MPPARTPWALAAPHRVIVALICAGVPLLRFSLKYPPRSVAANDPSFAPAQASDEVLSEFAGTSIGPRASGAITMNPSVVARSTAAPASQLLRDAPAYPDPRAVPSDPPSNRASAPREVRLVRRITPPSASFPCRSP